MWEFYFRLNSQIKKKRKRRAPSFENLRGDLIYSRPIQERRLMNAAQTDNTS